MGTTTQKQCGPVSRNNSKLAACPPVDVPDWCEHIRDMLGDNFIPPMALEQHWPGTANYSIDQISHLKNTMPNDAMLDAISKQGYVLIAGLPTKATFALNETTSFNLPYLDWLMVRLGAVPHSDNLTWEQQALEMGIVETVPDVMSVYYALRVYCHINGVDPSTYGLIRTKSKASPNTRYTVDCTGKSGIRIIPIGDDFTSPDLGIAGGIGMFRQ